MPLFAPGFEGELLDLTVTPLAGPVPDPDPARGHRDGRRHPQQLRPLRRLRDLAALLERGDHRRARRRWRRRSPRATRSTPTRSASWSAPWSSSRSRPGTCATRRSGFELRASSWRSRRDVRRVLLLMLPVTISLGLINFNLLINSFFGTPRLRRRRRRRSTRRSASTCCRRGSSRSRSRPCSSRPWPASPRAASSTNLRSTMANGMRQILLRADPGRRGDPRPLRADDPPRLPARRVRRLRRPSWSPRRSSGSPSRCRSTASSCCSPAPSSACSGPGCRPAIAGVNLRRHRARRARALQAVRGRRHRRRDRDRHRRQRRRPGVVLRRELGGLELARLLDATARITLASAALAGVSYGVWDVLDERARPRPGRPDRLARRRPGRRRGRLPAAVHGAAGARGGPDHAADSGPLAAR